MTTNPLPPAALDLAQEIITWQEGHYETRLENGHGVCDVAIYWRKASGFEIVSEIEYWGREWPATQYEPAEQEMRPGPAIRLETFKIQEVIEAFKDYGFDLK